MKPDVEPTVLGLRSVRTSPPRLVSAGASSTERISGSVAGACTESGVIAAPQNCSLPYRPPRASLYESPGSVNDRRAGRARTGRADETTGRPPHPPSEGGGYQPS